MGSGVCIRDSLSELSVDVVLIELRRLIPSEVYGVHYQYRLVIDALVVQPGLIGSIDDELKCFSIPARVSHLPNPTSD